MSAALAGRGWKGSSAAILGRGDLRAQGSVGGQIWGRSYGSPPPGCTPRRAAALLPSCKALRCKL